MGIETQRREVEVSRNKESSIEMLSNLSLPKVPSSSIVPVELDPRTNKVPDKAYIAVSMPQRAEEDGKNNLQKLSTEAEQEKLRAEILEMFEDSLDRNSDNEEFREKYALIDKEILRGHVPHFLSEIYEKRVGAGMDVAVEKLLGSMEEMIEKKTLGAENCVGIVEKYIKVLEFSETRRVANRLLELEGDKGVLGFSSETLERLENIGSKILENDEIKKVLNDQLTLRFNENETLLDKGLAVRIYSAAALAEQIPIFFPEKVNNTKTLFNVLEGLRGKFDANFAQYLEDAIAPLKEMEGTKTLTPSEENILQVRLKKIESIAKLSSELSYLPNETVSKLWMDNVRPLLEIVTPWETPYDSVKDEFKPKVEVREVEKLINSTKSGVARKLDVIDQLLGNDSFTTLTRKRMNLDFDITRKLEYLYKTTFDIRLNHFHRAEKRVEIASEINQKLESLDKILPLLNNISQQELLKVKEDGFRGLSQSIGETFNQRIKEVFLDLRPRVGPGIAEVNESVTLLLSQQEMLSKLAEEILPSEEYAAYLENRNQLKNLESLSGLEEIMDEVSSIAIKEFGEDIDYNSKKFLEHLAKGYQSLLVLAKSTVPDDSFGAFKQVVDLHYDKKVRSVHSSNAAEAIMEEYLELGKDIDPQIVKNVLINISHRIEGDIIKVFGREDSKLRGQSISESEIVKYVDKLDKEDPKAMWDLIKELDGYHSEDKKIQNRHFDILDESLQKYLRNELNPEQVGVLESYFVGGRSSISTIVDLVIRGTVEGSTVEDKLNAEVLRNAIDLKFTGTTPSTEFMDSVTGVEYGPERMLRQLAVRLDLSRGYDPEKRVESIDFVQKHLENNVPDSSLELRMAISFPSMSQLSEDDLGSFNEVQAMNMLYDMTPFQNGRIVNKWLDSYDADREMLTKAEQALSGLLVRDVESTKIFDQMALPRILDRPAHDSRYQSGAMEFLVGFATSMPGMERSQVELFHRLTQYRFKRALAWEEVSKYLEK